MTNPRSYRPGEHRSRREIDMAIGVLMATRRCSTHEAMEALANATRASGVGLGGVSRTLLTVISGDIGSPADGDALERWYTALGVPADSVK
jgi:ANTAR domain